MDGPQSWQKCCVVWCRVLQCVAVRWMYVVWLIQYSQTAIAAIVRRGVYGKFVRCGGLQWVVHLWRIYVSWKQQGCTSGTINASKKFADVFYKRSDVSLDSQYGVAMFSRLLKIIGLFCKRALWKRRYSTKETYDFKEPTNRSHPIGPCCRSHLTIYFYTSLLWVFLWRTCLFWYDYGPTSQKCL